MTSKRLTTAREAQAFIEAGRAKVSLRSLRTGKHFTYKIQQGEGAIWFVRGRTEHDYVYLGYINPTQGFQPSIRVPMVVQASPMFKAWDWFWNEVSHHKRLHPLLEVWHEGQCGMCGRELTDPESVRSGYGPDCRKKVLKQQGTQGKLWE